MIIINENNQSILLDTIYSPVPSNYLWVLDLEVQDYMLTDIKMLEEIIAPTVFLKVLGFTFPVPANWNVLIFGEDTGQVDIVDAGSLATNSFTALVSGPSFSQPMSAPLQVVDYKFEFTNIAPSLQKHQMMCHPINEAMWINISPSDNFNKYLRSAIVTDFF